jgi:O-antigen/teichoic acid export membrane protein
LTLSKIKFLAKYLTFVPFDSATEGGRSNERYRRIALSTGTSIFHKLVTVFTGLISIPLTVNYLGEERFGLWMAITSVIALLAFADLGLGNGLVNAVAKAEGENDLEYLQKAVSSTFFILLVVSLVFSVVLFILYPLVNWSSIFNVQTKVAITESGPTIFVLMSFFILNIPLGIISKIRIGLQEGYQDNFWLGMGAIIGFMGVLITIYFKLGLPYLVGSIMVGPLVALIANGYLLFYKRLYLLPKFNNFNFNISKNLLKVGFYFFLLQAFAVLSNSADNIIIAQVMGISSVATYAITKKLFLIIQITQFVIAPMWPAFIESLSRKNYRWAKSSLIKILKYSMFFGALTALPLLFFGDAIIKFWINENVIPSFYLLFGFFLFTIFQNYGGSMSVFLNNEDLIKKQLVFYSIASISALILQIVFIKIFGLPGVIFGLLLGFLMFYTVPAYKLAFGYLDNKIKQTEEKYNTPIN